MVVPPHPHTGLQTVSWLFDGRDRAPRQRRPATRWCARASVNLMTAGHGISHSEVSTPGTTACTASSCGSRCPTSARDGAPAFAHHDPDAGRAARDGGRGSSSARCSATTSPVRHRHAARRRRARPATPARRSTSTSTRPSSTACSSTPGWSPSTATEVKQHAAGATSRPADRPAARAAAPRAGPGAAARRRAVRRVDRDVVELRGPLPRGDRRLPRGVAGADHRRRPRRRPLRHPRRRPATADPRTPLCPTPGSANDVRTPQGPGPCGGTRGGREFLHEHRHPGAGLLGTARDVRQLHAQEEPRAQPHPGPGRRQCRDHAQARRRRPRDPAGRPRRRHGRLPRHARARLGDRRLARPLPRHPGERHPRRRRTDLARRQLQHHQAADRADLRTQRDAQRQGPVPLLRPRRPAA